MHAADYAYFYLEQPVVSSALGCTLIEVQPLETSTDFVLLSF